MRRNTVLEVSQNVNGTVSMDLLNTVPNQTNGIRFVGNIDVSNLTQDSTSGDYDTVKVNVDGVELVSENANGSYNFEFRSKPYGQQRSVDIEVMAEGTATASPSADIDLKIEA